MLVLGSFGLGPGGLQHVCEVLGLQGFGVRV